MSTDPAIEPWTRRVDALLAKAASTEFPAEAEALLAKAQSLMARHAIDEAMLQRAGSTRRGDIITTEARVERPYSRARCALLGAVARNNHCRMVVLGATDTGHRCVIIGHRTDVDHVLAMYATLSVHATRAMLAASAATRPRSYRHAFLLAYAVRIGERLWAARATAEAEAEQDVGASVAVALRERWAAVDQRVATEFPLLGRMRYQSSSGAGHAGGRAAASRAPLGDRPIAGQRGLAPGRP